MREVSHFAIKKEATRICWWDLHCHHLSRNWTEWYSNILVIKTKNIKFFTSNYSSRNLTSYTLYLFKMICLCFILLRLKWSAKDVKNLFSLTNWENIFLCTISNFLMLLESFYFWNFFFYRGYDAFDSDVDSVLSSDDDKRYVFV